MHLHAPYGGAVRCIYSIHDRSLLRHPRRELWPSRTMFRLLRPSTMAIHMCALLRPTTRGGRLWSAGRVRPDVLDFACVLRLFKASPTERTLRHSCKPEPVRLRPAYQTRLLALLGVPGAQVRAIQVPRSVRPTTSGKKTRRVTRSERTGKIVHAQRCLPCCCAKPGVARAVTSWLPTVGRLHFYGSCCSRLVPADRCRRSSLLARRGRAAGAT